MPTYTVDLPPKFYWDHVMRELPAGKVLRETKRMVRVELTEDEAREILSDAEFYSDAGIAADMQLPGLAASARATVKKMSAVLGGKFSWTFRHPDPRMMPNTIIVTAADEREARMLAGCKYYGAEKWLLQS